MSSVPTSRNRSDSIKEPPKSLVAQWNPHTLKSPHRLSEISEELRNFILVGLPGTGVRRWEAEPHHRQNTDFHRAIHFGWKRGQRVTKSCGCCLLVNKKIPVSCIRKVQPAPEELAGRGGYVWMEWGTVLIAAFVLYFPRAQTKEESRPSNFGSPLVNC